MSTTLSEYPDSLDIFKRQYFQLISVRHISWPNPTLLKQIKTQNWLYMNLFDDQNLKYPPPKRYQLQIIKQLLRQIEEAIDDLDEDDISDDLTSKLTNLLISPIPSESASAQIRSYVTYSFADLNITPSATLTTLESRSIISSSGTTGLRTWEATLHLSTFLCTSSRAPEFVSGKRVLELGAGTGLLSLLCAKFLGARKVIGTDGSQEVVEALEENIFLNGMDADKAIETKPFRWGSTPDDMAVDLVLGADITYDSSLFPALLSTFRSLLASNPKLTILISASIRNEDTITQFYKSCARSGLSITDINFPPQSEDAQRGPFYSSSSPIKIMEIRPLENINFDPFAI